MNLKVKICGITRKQDALNAVSAGVHALGFIFYSGSQRYIDPSKAREIIRILPPFVSPVGVFVNESREAIDEIARQTGIQFLQLSGDERPEDCLGLHKPVIKSFRIRSVEDVGIVESYTICAALLDGAPEGMYGGSGKLADFETAKAIKHICPLILAGGLNPDNVVVAVNEVRPYAIDVNSGVEHEPGIKDLVKIRLLFERLSERERTILPRN